MTSPIINIVSLWVLAAMLTGCSSTAESDGEQTGATTSEVQEIPEDRDYRGTEDSTTISGPQERNGQQNTNCGARQDENQDPDPAEDCRQDGILEVNSVH